MVQVCNALLENVLPPATEDPALNFIYVKRLADVTGVEQVTQFAVPPGVDR